MHLVDAFWSTKAPRLAAKASEGVPTMAKPSNAVRRGSLLAGFVAAYVMRVTAICLSKSVIPRSASTASTINNGIRVLGQKRDHRPLHYHTLNPRVIPDNVFGRRSLFNTFAESNGLSDVDARHILRR